MKHPFLFCLLGAAICFGAIGCEMHPPSETIPGYAEKTSGPQKATTAEGTNPNAPTFFPPKPDAAK